MKNEAKQPTAPVTPAVAKPPASSGWSLLEDLRRDIDHLFESFHAGDWRSPLHRGGLGVDLPSVSGMRWHLAPAIDVVERDDAYQMTAELPGVERDSIDLKIAGGRLTLRGEKKEEKEEREGERYVAERRYGAFSRSVALPEDIDADRITASCADGVLTITLPKTAEARGREKRIEIAGG